MSEEQAIRVTSLSAEVLAILWSISEAVATYYKLLCERTGSLLED